MPELDLDWVQARFPALTNGWSFLENAGGAYMPVHVVDRMTAFMTKCQVQPGGPAGPSADAQRRLDEARQRVAAMINADPSLCVFGPSTTLNVYVLVRALRPLWREGDEIIVTNQDHEANSGQWRRLAETGIIVREWRIEPDKGMLDPAELETLLGPRTRLVAFPHVSNIVGANNDAKAIVAQVHAAGALACVDGVAYVAHHALDVSDIGADIYLFSFYKLFGPHIALMAVSKEVMEAAEIQNHVQLAAATPPYKLNPGGMNYEAVASTAGIVDYLDAMYDHHFDTPENDPAARTRACFGLIRSHEMALMAPLLEGLDAHPDVRLIGPSEPAAREPTIAFDLPGKDLASVQARLADDHIQVGLGSFYAWRCLEGLGIDPDRGVLRVSAVHYNGTDEIERLLAHLR